MVERCNCDKRHDHNGPWGAIFAALMLLVLGFYLVLALGQHQFKVIYDRVGEIQRQLECWPAEVLVTDQEGNEYCFDVEEGE
jgi:hypothetical protein